MPTKQPFGTWVSPITAESLVAGAVGISEVIPDGDDVWWAESRPGESGRTALMRHRHGATEEMTEANASVRTTVHEYGGGAWWVDAGRCYYVDYQDQRLRVLQPGREALLLSENPALPGSIRYSDFRLTIDGYWIIAVCEVHIEQGEGEPVEPVNSIRAIATDGSQRCFDLVTGADFYGSPRLSPDGTRLCWIEWNHPNMPWDDTQLFTVRLNSSFDFISAEDPEYVAGGPGEAIVQPKWSPSSELHFLSDCDDHWQVYRQGGSHPVHQVEGEIGYPPWVFGLSRYCFKSNGDIVAAGFNLGVESLAGYEGYTAFHSIRSSGDKIALVAASWSEENTVYYDGIVVKKPRDNGIDRALLVAPERLEFPTSGGDTAYALYFKPANPEYLPCADDKPPLIVLAHGGPTSAARSQLSLARLFWTSRGFAVVDVNYRGSSGFGRSYRKKLEGQWGVVDVEDCVNAAKFLAKRGDVDPKRLIIRGGSAGGFTVLSALAFHDTFTAGASMYGVADLEALAADTHKFESRYLDNLVGPYPAEKALYQARSPIQNLDGFSAPMIVLQGTEDRIVPPNQSRMIVQALTDRSVPVAYLEFDGEQHGFRKSATIVRALGSELSFYGRIFGFVPAGDLPDVDIVNEPTTIDLQSY